MWGEIQFSTLLCSSVVYVRCVLLEAVAVCDYRLGLKVMTLDITE